MTSQRILSGSKTKGSTASLTGSAQYFYQGTSVRTFGSYVGSLLPRIGSSDRVELYKDGNPVSRLKEFDDSIIINNDLSDMGGTGDGKRIEERVNHSYENRNFGQAPTTLLGEPYADTKGFNPVHYIQDPGDVMWPTNMWNAGELDDHEFNGIIEPLDIRRELFGDLDTRYEGRAVRGSLVGASSERPWGSKEIKDSWRLIDNQEIAFLDSPLIKKVETSYFEIFGLGAPEEFWQNRFQYQFAPPNHETIYEYSQAAAGSIQLWGSFRTSDPEDLSTETVSMGYVENDTTRPDVGVESIGEYNYTYYDGSAFNGYVSIENVSYWNSILGDKGQPSDTHEFTLGAWIKGSADFTTDDGTIFAFGSVNSRFLNSHCGLKFYARGTGLNPSLLIDIGDTAGSNNDKDTWQTIQTSTALNNNNWNFVTAVVTIDNDARTTDVVFYVNAEVVPDFQAAFDFTTSPTSHWSIRKILGGVDVACIGAIGHVTYASVQERFQGKIAMPCIWDSALTAEDVKAIYGAVLARKNSIGYNAVEAENQELLAIQAYQDIKQSPDIPMIDNSDYHDKVYFSLFSHNNSDMRAALRKLNSSSCDRITDPFEKRSHRGLAEGQSVGSLAFSNSIIVGEEK